MSQQSEFSPLGHGGGLDSDTVDGLHLEQILYKARKWSGGGPVAGLPCNYLIYKEGSYVKVLNGSTGKIDYRVDETDFALVINSAILSANSSNGGVVYIKSASYTLSTQIVMKSNVDLILDRNVSIDASALGAHAISLSSISKCAILGGKWITDEGYVVFDVDSSSDITIIPSELGGLGGGIYVHGTSTDCLFAVPYAYQLGKGSGGASSKDGVAVYIEENCERIIIPYVEAYDSGTTNSWTGGMYSGRNIHVGQVIVRNCYGGGVGLGFENNTLRDSIIDSVEGDTLNTYACCVYHTRRVTIGRVNGYKCGMITAPYEYEPAFGIYGDAQAITVGGIIAEESGDSGVSIAPESGNIQNVRIGNIVARNNSQKAGATVGAGVNIYATNNLTIDDVWIGSVSAVDTQGSPTQQRGLYIGCSSGATLKNLHIDHIYYSGNITARIGYGIAGTYTNNYLGDRMVHGTKTCITTGTAVDFSDEGFHDQPDTSYHVLLTALGEGWVQVENKTTTGFTIDVEADMDVDWMVFR